MSIASNAGAQAAAEEIAAFVVQRRAALQTDDRLNPVVRAAILAELGRVEAKAKEIAAVAESGWY